MNSCVAGEISLIIETQMHCGKTSKPFHQDECAPQIRKHVGLCYNLHFRPLAVTVAGAIIVIWINTTKKKKHPSILHTVSVDQQITLQVIIPGYYPTGPQN